MNENPSSSLRIWLKSLSTEDQELYFRKAARFFSSRELSEIIAHLRNRCSLYTAHEKTGVLDRYIVDLQKIRSGFPVSG